MSPYGVIRSQSVKCKITHKVTQQLHTIFRFSRIEYDIEIYGINFVANANIKQVIQKKFLK